LKNSIIQELKYKKPATILWLFIIIVGFIVAIYSWLNPPFIYLGLVGSGIIFSSILCHKFEKQINEKVSHE